MWSTTGARCSGWSRAGWSSSARSRSSSRRVGGHGRATSCAGDGWPRCCSLPPCTCPRPRSSWPPVGWSTSSTPRSPTASARSSGIPRAARTAAASPAATAASCRSSPSVVTGNPAVRVGAIFDQAWSAYRLRAPLLLGLLAAWGLTWVALEVLVFTAGGPPGDPVWVILHLLYFWGTAYWEAAIAGCALDHVAGRPPAPRRYLGNH